MVIIKEYKKEKIYLFKTLLNYQFDKKEFIMFLKKQLNHKINIKSSKVTNKEIRLTYTINNRLFKPILYTFLWNYDNVNFDGMNLEIVKAINSYIIYKGRNMGVIGIG